MSEEEMPHALSDYLIDGCQVEQVVYDVTDRLGPTATGRLTLVPSRLNADVIAQIVGRGYDAGLLDELFRILSERFAPDVLILDTHASMTNETMVALAAADAVVIVMRADQQDYRGAAVTTAVTRRLNCPRVMVVVNKVAAGQDPEKVRAQAESAYGCAVAAVIPYSTDVAELAGGNVFVLEHPEHALTGRFARITEQLVELVEPGAAVAPVTP
jgi:MinD-like ATPase involved in chromosome partitioning or flagellar assembly